MLTPILKHWENHSHTHKRCGQLPIAQLLRHHSSIWGDWNGPSRDLHFPDPGSGRVGRGRLVGRCVGFGGTGRCVGGGLGRLPCGRMAISAQFTNVSGLSFIQLFPVDHHHWSTQCSHVNPSGSWRVIVKRLLPRGSFHSASPLGNLKWWTLWRNY